MGNTLKIANNGKCSFNKNCYTDNKFFADEVICKVIDCNTLQFTKPTLDYKGKTHKADAIGLQYRFGISGNIEIGTYLLDEEDSNEDVLYYVKAN